MAQQLDQLDLRLQLTGLLKESSYSTLLNELDITNPYPQIGGARKSTPFLLVS
jgi:hypothetical protein